MKRKRDPADAAAAETAAARTKLKTEPVSILKKTKKAAAAAAAATTTTTTAPTKEKAAKPEKAAKAEAGATPKPAKHGTKTNGRGAAAAPAPAPAPATATTTTTTTAAAVVDGDGPVTIQIVAGSYDRTLHGVTATVRGGGSGSGSGMVFADTFLFNAHASAVRCLALSPASAAVAGQGQKVMLATGSTDERVNIYHLSAHPPAAAAAGQEEQKLLASVETRRAVMPIAENARNRELGTLLHHAATVTQLAFPTRSKLLSASEDSTVAVTRTRDWSLLSMIRAPVPKAGMGGAPARPSGDTAAPGAAPSGINGFAVHPSLKVMISVSRGERCMRLWNLVTGKKAGVLNFGRDLLRDLGEGRYGTGAGRQVVWGRQRGDGNGKDNDDGSEATDEFAIGFDRNVVVFGMDSVPRCKVLPHARTKTHDLCYVEVERDEGAGADADAEDVAFSLLAVATEDGRILLASTRPQDLEAAAPVSGGAAPLPCARLVGQVGGAAAGVTGRVKAFKVLPVLETPTGGGGRQQRAWYVVTASSTGALRVWKLTGAELRAAFRAGGAPADGAAPARQLGTLLGTYQTPDRITCLEAFVMIPRPADLADSEGEEEEEEEEEEGE